MAFVENFVDHHLHARLDIRYPQMAEKSSQIKTLEWEGKRFEDGAVQFPLSLVIRITEECFLKCRMCGQGGLRGRVDKNSKENKIIDKVTVNKIIQDASELTVKPFVKITGGEPLTWKGIFDLLSDLRQKKFVTMVNTNGVLLDNEETARKLAGTDVNVVSVSLDGDRETHNRIRGNTTAFDRTVQGLINLNRERKKFNQSNLMIVVSMVVSVENQHLVKKVYEIAAAANVDLFRLQYLNYTTRKSCKTATSHMKAAFEVDTSPWEHFRLPELRDGIQPEKIADLIRSIQENSVPLPLSVMGNFIAKDEIEAYHSSFHALEKSVCSIPYTAMHIVPPGKACFCIDYPGYFYGDLRKDSILSVWQSDKAVNFRRSLSQYYKTHSQNFPQCRRCNWLFN